MTQIRLFFTDPLALSHAIGYGLLLITLFLLYLIWRKKRLFYLLLPLAFLTFSVPWFYENHSSEMRFGFPQWVIFSLVGAIGFALLMNVLIGFFWEASAGKNDEDE
jgi:hypothetical protein